jgi:hypothetical protein
MPKLSEAERDERDGFRFSAERDERDGFRFSTDRDVMAQTPAAPEAGS